jgi:hypothetical protein
MVLSVGCGYLPPRPPPLAGRALLSWKMGRGEGHRRRDTNAPLGEEAAPCGTRRARQRGAEAGRTRPQGAGSSIGRAAGTDQRARGVAAGNAVEHRDDDRGVDRAAVIGRLRQALQAAAKRLLHEPATRCLQIVDDATIAYLAPIPYPQ